LTDPDAAIRKKSIAYISEFIDVAAQFNAPAIIGSMQGRWGENGSTREQALGWLAETLQTLGPRAKKQGTVLLYEPLNRYETNLFNRSGEAATFLEQQHIEGVSLLCDLFHMNIEEADVAATLRTVKKHVGHIHFADSNRRAVGLGHTDMAPIAQALIDINYQTFISAEIMPLPDEETAARETIASYQRWFGGVSSVPSAAQHPRAGQSC
jgi:sugar phosphate isomerase/epimerase